MSEVQCSLPSPRYEEFSGLCGVLKCECIYNPAWVTLNTEVCNLAKLQMNSHLAELQISRKEVKGGSWKSVSQKIKKASLQRVKKCMWSKMNVCLKWMRSQAWALEGIFPWVPVGDFPKNFQGGPKVVKFVFYHPKLKKQPFLLIISKSRESL